MGVDVLRTTTQRSVSEADGLISMWGSQAGTWMKSPALARAAYSPCCTPTNFADPLQHVGDGLLLAVMVYPGARSRHHLEQAAPQGRVYAAVRRNRRKAYGTRRLCGVLDKRGRTDDTNWRM